MSSEVYLANLEALGANASVLNPLVGAMDRILEEPTFAFGGDAHKGPWQQSSGPANDQLNKTSLQVVRDFETGVRIAQATHLEETGQFLGATMYKGASFALVLRGPSQTGEYPALLRRVELFGLTPDGRSREREYRVDVPEGDGVIRILELTYLGHVAISAREHMRDTVTMDLARRSLSQFSDDRAVEALLTGDFTGEAGLQRLLDRLNARPAQLDLVDELRIHAGRTLEGRKLTTATNLALPDRDQLTTWHGSIQRVFG